MVKSENGVPPLHRERVRFSLSIVGPRGKGTQGKERFQRTEAKSGKVESLTQHIPVPRRV